MKRTLLALMFLSALSPAPRLLAAQVPPDPHAPPEKPERIVRASFVEGDASYQRGDADDWNDLGANTPLMTGDSVYTAKEARAEISLGRGNFARLANDTQIDLVSLTSDVTQIGVSSGHMYLQVGSSPQGSTIEIDTPNATAAITAPGTYRVTVDPRRTSFEVVRGGLSVALNGEQLDVDDNETLGLDDAEPPTYEYGRVRPSGPFDAWAAGRDERFQKAESAHHVHADVDGYEDLDEHGAWRADPTYGSVWVPAGVSPDWAPYQSGRWVWQDPYGWTWVSYESWGWAPYHYGRWVSVGGGWAWVPPPPAGFIAPTPVVMPQPVYAPALVAFVGGSHWSVGVSIGSQPNIGWVPLAPAEPYYYPWQPAPTTSVHYTNITVVNSVTVVNQNTFVTGRGDRVHYRPEQVRDVPVMGTSPTGVAPTRDSLASYPPREGRKQVAPPPEQQRPFVTRLVPPPKQTPFRDKEQTIRTTGKPVREPIAYGGDVGKPYERGTKVPEGVNARSALSAERPQKLQARGENRGRGPRPIEHDIQPMTPHSEGKPEGAPAQVKPGMPGPHEPRGGTPSTASAGGEPPAATGQPAQPPEGESTKGHGRWQKLHRTPPPQSGQPQSGQPQSGQPQTKPPAEGGQRGQTGQEGTGSAQPAKPAGPAGSAPSHQHHPSGNGPSHHAAPSGTEPPQQARPSGGEKPAQAPPADVKQKDSKEKDGNAKKPEAEKKKKKKD
ncbi:MAG: FecR domain-containing protein [Acidobacteria bacterium]|nr:FecR domain-containing protein [Acidobacteriota bacterium]